MKLIHTIVAGILLSAIVHLDAKQSDTDYAKKRKEMVETIEKEVQRTKGLLGKDKLSPRVIEALLSVRRHLFVPPEYRGQAYENRPLPIGYGQTISQPYMVAVMTDLLEPGPEDVVLEVGTGSGYQAAILAKIVRKVYTIEIVEPLALQARERLKKLGYDNVEVIVGDGYYGLPEHAPYDEIIVTAATGQIPPPLIRQLKRGGRMVVPVGSVFGVQQLVYLTKDANGTVQMRQIMPVRFVPLTGKR